MPMNMMQSILDKTGLGGFRTGISDRDQLIHSNQDLADKELINRRNTNLYENELLDNPLKAAERAMKLAKAESDAADITSGGYDKQRQLEREKQAAELAAKLDENQRKKIEDAANAAVRAASIFKEDDTPLLKEQKWGTAAQILRDAGQTNVPDRYDPTAYEALMMRAKAAPMTLQHIQTLANKDKDHANAVALSTHNFGQTIATNQMNNVAAQLRQDSQNQTTLEAARIRERGDNARHNSNPILTKSKEVVAAKNRVDAAIRGEGEASLLDFESVAANDYGPIFKRNLDMLKDNAQKRIEALNQDLRMYSDNPKKKAEIENEIEKVAAKLQRDVESRTYPPSFKKKYDEVRKKEYGSVEAAPIPDALIQSSAPSATTPAAPATGPKNIDEWRAKEAAETERVDKIKATPEYLALQAEYNTALASRNHTEARSIKAEMDKLLGVAPKSAAAPAAKSGRTEVNRGVRKSDGKTVILYSDGTKEVQ